jgi:hypothetical protein
MTGIKKDWQSKYDAESFRPGCYVDESAGSSDDCNRRTVEFAEAYGFPVDDHDEGDLTEVGDDAVEYLNSLENRTAIYWQFDDNSLYLLADPESAREQVEFVSSKEQEYPGDEYQGEWLHVNDHGNATLYCRTEGKDKEIWSVV